METESRFVVGLGGRWAFGVTTKEYGGFGRGWRERKCCKIRL